MAACAAGAAGIPLAPRSGVSQHVVAGPILLPSGMEISISRCPRALRTDIEAAFPALRSAAKQEQRAVSAGDGCRSEFAASAHRCCAAPPPLASAAPSYSAVPAAHDAACDGEQRRRDADHLLVVTTCQHSTVDLVRSGPDVATEKDVLLEKVRRRLRLSFAGPAPNCDNRAC
jgi:hypothetical protein